MPRSDLVLSQINAAQAKRRNPQDILSTYEKRLGLPSAQQRLMGLRGAITNTEELLRNVDPSVTGRTAGTFTTEAQRQKLVSNERAPISSQLVEQGRALEGETANISDLSQRALTQTQLAAEADDKRINSLQNMYDTLYRREQDEIARQERAAAAAEARKAAAAQNAYLQGLMNQNAQARAASAPMITPQQAVRQGKAVSQSGLARAFNGGGIRKSQPRKPKPNLWDNIVRAISTKGDSLFGGIFG